METEEKETKPRFGLVNFERRSHPRFSINLPIEYWHVDSSESHLGRIINVSEGGLLIYIPEEVGLGKNLRLKIFFGSGPDLNSLEALVEVVWRDIQLDDSKDYRFGVKFVNPSPEDMDKLKGFLNNLMNSKSSQKGP